MIVVTMQHCREVGYCARGVRAFFKLHGLDLAQFLSEGLPAEVIESTGDAMALAAAKRARNG
jgi:hypothetical protein